MTYTCNTAYGLTSIKHRTLSKCWNKKQPKIKPFEFTGDIFRGMSMHKTSFWWFHIEPFYQNLGLSGESNYPFFASKQVKNDAIFEWNMHVLHSLSSSEDRCKHGFKLCHKISDLELSNELSCTDESNSTFYNFLNFTFSRTSISIYLILHSI